jgi:hypothetical protein
MVRAEGARKLDLIRTSAITLSLTMISFFGVISVFQDTALAAQAVIWEQEMEITGNPTPNYQFSPDIAAGQGKVHIVWEEVMIGWDIYYRQYTGSFWANPGEMSTDLFWEDQTSPAISAGGGTAHAAWFTWSGGSNISSRYYDGSSWYTERLAQSNTGMMWWSGPSIASNGGEAFLVWPDDNDGDADVFYSYYDGSQWNTRMEISTDSGAEQQYDPNVAVGADKVHFIWMDSEDGDYDIRYRSHNWTHWQAEQNVSQDVGTENQWSPALAAYDDEVHIVWADGRDGDGDIYYRNFNGTEWQPMVEISTDLADEEQTNPGIAVQGEKIHVVWEDNRDGDWDIFYRNFDGSGWEPVQEISTDTFGERQGDPEIAVDNDKIYVVWVHDTGADSDIYFRRGVIDTTSPESEVLTLGYYWQQFSTFDISWNATDNYSLQMITVYYRYSDDNSTWSSWVVWETDSTLTGIAATGYFPFFLPHGDGFYELYSIAQDTAGNIEDLPVLADAIFGFDGTAPVGSILINGGSDWTNATQVTLQLTAIDQTSGVDKIRISNDGIWDTEPWEPPNSTRSWDLEIGEGQKTVYYQIRERAGLESVTYTDSIGFDQTPPMGFIEIENGATWTTSPSVNLGLFSLDNLSGVSVIRLSNDGVWDSEPWEPPSSSKTWTLTNGDGLKTVYYQVMDNASVLSPTYNDTIVLDSESPTATILINSGVNYTADPPVTLSLSYSDNESGVSEVRYSNDGVWDTESWESPASSRAWTLPVGDGVKTVHYQVKDRAGKEFSTKDDIILDTEPPEGSILINDGDVCTTSLDVILSLTYSDSGSGVNQIRFSNDGTWDSEIWEEPTDSKAWTLGPGSTTRTVFYQIIDNIGRLSTTFWDNICWDNSPPTGSIVINDGDALTNSTSVTLTLIYSDAAPGALLVRFSNDGIWDTEPWESPSPDRSWVLDPGDGLKTVYYQIVDSVGLISEAYSDNITLDATPPGILIVVPMGSTGLDSAATINVTFTEGVDTDATEDAFRLVHGSTTIEGTFQWSNDGETMVFSPAENLKGGETYWVFITEECRDLAGNALVETHESGFSIIEPPGDERDEDDMWIVVVASVGLIVMILVSAYLLFRRSKQGPSEGRSRAQSPEISNGRRRGGN